MAATRAVKNVLKFGIAGTLRGDNVLELPRKVRIDYLKNGNGLQRNGGKGIGKQRLRIPDASPDG
jgi:hypothetical protein